MCGGTAGTTVGYGQRGLSPRVRGNQAGLSPRVRGNQDESVYPRVCGGTAETLRHVNYMQGLSPRVRGNPTEGQSGILTTVYPRVCGGTKASLAAVPAGLGLSPRVRGNPFADGRKGRGRGSIPACAGEPAMFRLLCDCYRVYPRVCGGTSQRDIRAGQLGGLSPRVRGNPPARCWTCCHARVYPRVCGGTTSLIACTWVARVYPRVCGGTSRPTETWCSAGLSPRVRGNLRARLNVVGDPCGLSPRVRGNLCVGFHFAYRLHRSIPACAGEPASLPLRLSPAPVYPRVCGGTSSSSMRSPRSLGLSPRVRGNLLYNHESSGERRSIPACAGEPGPGIRLLSG